MNIQTWINKKKWKRDFKLYCQNGNVESQKEGGFLTN